MDWGECGSELDIMYEGSTTRQVWSRRANTTRRARRKSACVQGSGEGGLGRAGGPWEPRRIRGNAANLHACSAGAHARPVGSLSLTAPPARSLPHLPLQPPTSTCVFLSHCRRTPAQPAPPNIPPLRLTSAPLASTSSWRWPPCRTPGCRRSPPPPRLPPRPTPPHAAFAPCCRPQPYDVSLSPPTQPCTDLQSRHVKKHR